MRSAFITFSLMRRLLLDAESLSFLALDINESTKRYTVRML